MIISSRQNPILGCIKLHYSHRIIPQPLVGSFDRTFSFVPFNKEWLSIFSSPTWKKPDKVFSYGSGILIHPYQINKYES